MISACGVTKLYQHPVLAAPGIESATIHVLRPKSFVGGGVSLSVQFNGARLLKMKNGTCTTVYLQPGSYTVKTDRNVSSAPPGMSTSFEFGTAQIELVAGETYYLLVVMDMSSDWSFWTGNQMHFSHNVGLIKPAEGEELRRQLEFVAVSPQC
jgi:hypothetical protein